MGWIKEYASGGELLSAVEVPDEEPSPTEVTDSRIAELEATVAMLLAQQEETP